MSWPALALLHLLPTLYMTGLIWFVQVVHYPLFAAVGQRDFQRYEREHCRLTTFVVLPPMVAELALASWLCFAAPAPALPWAIAGLGIVLGIWAATFFVQVPCHDRLQREANLTVMRRLTRSNWLRTAGWTLRTAIAVVLVWPPAA